MPEICFDGSGRFQLPEAPSSTARHIEVDDAALEALLDGIDVNDVAPRSRAKTH